MKSGIVSTARGHAADDDDEKSMLMILSEAVSQPLTAKACGSNTVLASCQYKGCLEQTFEMRKVGRLLVCDDYDNDDATVVMAKQKIRKHAC